MNELNKVETMNKKNTIDKNGKTSNIKTLRQIDPVLYNNITEVYTRKCQKDRQPMIVKGDAIKKYKDNQLTKY